MLAVSLALGSAGQLLLVFKNSIILFDLTDLLLQRLNQHVSVFDILFRSVLFRCGLVGLSLLPLTAQLKLLQLLSLRLVTEISPLQVRLELPLGSRSFLAVARKLNELLVLLVLDEIPLASELRVVGEELRRLSLSFVNVAPQCPDKFAVPAIVRLRLECLIFDQKIRCVTAGFLLYVKDLFLKLMPLGLKLSPQNFCLALGFIKVL